ncbi:MAG: ATP-binding protein [Acidobacteriota bacterium]
MRLLTTAAPASRDARLSAKDLAELERHADRSMARNSRTGIATYPCAVLLLASSSSFASDHPLLVAGLVACSLAVAALRAHLVWQFDPIYQRQPRRWQLRFALGVVAATLLWSLAGSSATFFYGVSWISFLAVLMSVTIASMATIVYARSQTLVLVLGLAMLGPHIAVGLLIDSQEGLWISAALAAFLAYIGLTGRHFHNELWKGLVEAKILARQAADLDRARVTAEAARASHGEFLATLSHEIRTPLGGILGLSELLATSSDRQDWERFSRVIHSTAESLMSLVDSILDFSKIEASKLELEATDFSLRRMLREIIEMHSPRASHKGIRLTTELGPDLPDWLVGDALRLRQVLVNLLGNAIKFTQDGHVTLRVSAQRRSDTPWLRFEVEDTGVGIEETAQSDLFVAFEQADSSITRRFGGTGLGLAICSSLVKLHGGDIGFDSTPGVGSTFWVELPLALSTLPLDERDRPAGRKPTSAEIRIRERDDCRILLVEDNEVNRIVALQTLESLGIRADASADGSEALKQLELQDYDLVLMDCEMPIVDGFEATQMIRRRETGRRHTPIVAMTAHAMAGDREKCLAAGMDDYLKKPFRRQDLVEVLDRALLRRNSVVQLAEEAAAEAKPEHRFSGGPGELDPERIDCLRQLGSEGTDALTHIGRIFLQRAHALVAQLRQEFDQGDFLRLRLSAHSLNGSSSNIGAKRLSDLCREVELLAQQKAILDYPEKIDQVQAEFVAVEESLTKLLRASPKAGEPVIEGSSGGARPS